MSLKEARRSRNLTQNKLSIKIGVKRSLVSMWEIGLGKPSIFQIQDIAKVLGITTDEAISLFKGDKNNEKTA